ncbi:inorganic phosphate transporter [Protaetiibacter mangrovi]|uniref:Phosphate transporter n=2 Tax=Microbacteriaceae TaxID=85023 RepID=A0ABT1ZBE7_9MICO|nr:inorganic phosphate transporter [Protaetiibacter mangrovi]MCS0498013.1 inorganic phosphate transporter [Protaetiibacter mangrovi]
MDPLILVALVIALALFFDFTNGFHDTANAMATPIATGALGPKTAVALAAVLNLIGAFLSTEVAKTISGGLIREGDGGVQIGPELILAGLIGAIVWNLVTWLLGLPSSSSHALFGGLIGASVVGAGFGVIDGGVLVSKILIPAVLAPVTAGVVSYLATKIAYAVTRKRERDGFKKGQIFTSSLVSLAHGTNDAQKTMGVITLALIAAGFQTVGSGPELWVIAACAIAIAAGTYSGGWRIIRTMGRGITDVEPAQGFAAEAATTATILASTHLGFALSTTQVASGSVIGTGIGRKGASVRWRTAGRIALGWLITIPAAGLVGAAAALLVQLGPGGIVAAVVLALVAITGIFLWSRRSHVDHRNLHQPEPGVFVRPKKRKARR